MQNTTHTKLQAIRDKRKRWQTRLTRASNMLGKLAKQEARLLKAEIRPLGKPFSEPFAETPLPELDRFFAPTPKPETFGEAIRESIADQLDIPTELKRQPVDVDKLKADRKAKEKVDRTAMPLTGKEAMAAIKAQSEAVSKRRAKKELRMR